METIRLQKDGRIGGYIAWEWEDPEDPGFRIRGLRIEYSDDAIRKWLIEAILGNSQGVLLDGKEAPTNLENDLDGVLQVLDLAEKQYKGFVYEALDLESVNLGERQ